MHIFIQKSLLVLYISIISTPFLFSQSEKDKKEIYNKVIEYYHTKYVHDSTKSTFIIDSTKSFHLNSLNNVIWFSRRSDRKPSYLSFYKTYFNIDTSNNTNYEDFNRKFYENANIREDLTNYLSDNIKVKLIKKNILDTFFIYVKEGDNVESLFQIADKRFVDLEKNYNCKGFCSVSKPYIIQENSKAILYFSFTHSPVNGASMVLILAKENNKWVVKEEIRIITS
jgi:hypothetical protein